MEIGGPLKVRKVLKTGDHQRNRWMSEKYQNYSWPRNRCGEVPPSKVSAFKGGLKHIRIHGSLESMLKFRIFTIIFEPCTPNLQMNTSPSLTTPSLTTPSANGVKEAKNTSWCRHYYYVPLTAGVCRTSITSP